MTRDSKPSLIERVRRGLRSLAQSTGLLPRPIVDPNPAEWVIPAGVTSIEVGFVGGGESGIREFRERYEDRVVSILSPGGSLPTKCGRCDAPLAPSRIGNGFLVCEDCPEPENPADALLLLARSLGERTGREVDEAAFDRLRERMNEPIAATTPITTELPDRPAPAYVPIAARIADEKAKVAEARVKALARGKAQSDRRRADWKRRGLLP